MGLPPRSLTAEANGCFMVRVPHGPNRIQGCGASIAPERGLPSDQLYRTSNNEGHRVAVTLDTKVLIQGCVKTRMRSQRHAAETGCRKAWLLAADRGLDGPAIRTSRQGFGPALINALTTLQG